MKSTLNHKLPAMPRRTAMRLAAGGAMGLVLAACGGGGGDGSSGDVQALRDAFAKLHDGMVWTDVEALVGFSANNWRSETNLKWVIDGVSLYVRFHSSTPSDISGATLSEADGVSEQFKSFE